VDLESHWKLPVRPSIAYTSNETIYEAQFARLLDQFPCPDEYIKDTDFLGSEQPVVKEF
jgi:hypothetical protein